MKTFTKFNQDVLLSESRLAEIQEPDEALAVGFNEDGAAGAGGGDAGAGAASGASGAAAVSSGPSCTCGTPGESANDECPVHGSIGYGTTGYPYHKKKKKKLPEDAPTNNAGSGNIAGLGVGAQGEPGVSPMYQRLRGQVELVGPPEVDPRIFRDMIFKRSKPKK